ncbi:hypothetical protein [Flavobacterium silvaticum]|uniref:Uncharacterized protein n=1 Tax=Flavobacterium silvaticum TaxID=1852020 RepID=A0A972FPC4_9FLAO|nr:hypothetical protein [Flavobacterium silvaticum]NMH29388.1 hypothetical protein [Flavobacterium silvaticum]
MENNQYLDDLKDIRRMMNQSTQFLSLSGLAGILAGCYSLIGAFVAKQILNEHRGYYVTLESTTFRNIVLIALGVLVLSIVTAMALTFSKAKKNNESFWNTSSKRLLLNFLIPLGTGGIFCLLLLRHQVYGLIAPVTLIFYGLACVNASKYTMGDVRYLGLSITILGLICTEFSGYGLYFWALGFGVCHIIYGSIMYYKYDLKRANN